MKVRARGVGGEGGGEGSGRRDDRPPPAVPDVTPRQATGLDIGVVRRAS